MNLCLPAITLATARRTSYSKLRTSGPRESTTLRHASRLPAIRRRPWTSWSCCWPRPGSPIQDLHSLAVGDIIATDQLVQSSVDGGGAEANCHFLRSPGAVEGQKAVRIDAVIAADLAMPNPMAKSAE